MLNPDAAHLLPETMNGIGKREMEHFLYRCPDFVIELLSKSDRLSEAQAKMARSSGRMREAMRPSSSTRAQKAASSSR